METAELKSSQTISVEDDELFVLEHGRSTEGELCPAEADHLEFNASDFDEEDHEDGEESEEELMVMEEDEDSQGYNDDQMEEDDESVNQTKKPYQKDSAKLGESFLWFLSD